MITEAHKGHTRSREHRAQGWAIQDQDDIKKLDGDEPILS